MNVNLEYYKIFYYVAKFRGITAAAQELCLSQPAVSQAVAHLEKSLDSKLFIRMSKGVKLTPEGEVLYSYVKQGYEYICRGEMAFRKMRDLENGEIRIGASDMTLQYYLLPYLEKFHEKYPGIKVTVTNAPTPETIDYLKSGKIDFGSVSSPVEESPGIKIIRGREIEDIFVAGIRFLEFKNRIVSFKELEKLPVICLEQKTSTRKYVDYFLKINNVILKPEFELATSGIIVQFALRNLGIGCVVKDFAREYMETGELFQIRFQKKIPKRQICIITSDKIPLSAAAEKLLSMINET